MKVTKEEFNDYVEVQKSGLTNMFNVRLVKKLTDLTRKKILYIMKNYQELILQYGEAMEVKK